MVIGNVHTGHDGGLYRDLDEGEVVVLAYFKMLMHILI